MTCGYVNDLFFYLTVDIFIYLLLFKGHTCVYAPEIHPSEVQQLLRVSLVGILDRLVPGHVISLDDSCDHGLQTGQRKRNSLAGRWLF